MLILEQWPRQIAPAAGRTLASNFRVLRVWTNQPASFPSFFLDHPCQRWCLASHGARLPRSLQLPPGQLPQQHCSPAGGAAGGALCQVRVPRTGPGPARELQANAPGRKAVSPQGAEMGSETCPLRASSVKGSAGEDGRPTCGGLCCVSIQLEYCNPRRIHSLMGNHKC